ncbi:MAG: SDR family NAD(P)-dependent oxidoreductase [Planctomycetota bacterium]|jgi:3-oxoacyl-[acyl-carrier protein] reductase
MPPGIEGHRAYVTGATRGIGLAIARALGEAGAHVVSGCRDTDNVAVGEPFVCNLREPALPPGPLHFLVNNAGIWLPTPVEGAGWDAGWDEQWRVNLKGAADLCRLFAEQAEPGSCIVNISSRASRRGEPGYAAYAATKAALNALTKSLAGELGPRGIRVNAVAPGWVVTDMTRESLDAEQLPEPIPLGRVGEPEDVAGPVVFLCSDLARYVTGIVLDVNGGSYLH